MGSAARGGVGFEHHHIEAMAGGDGTGTEAAETTAHDDQVAHLGRRISAADPIQISFASTAIAALDPCLGSTDHQRFALPQGISPATLSDRAEVRQPKRGDFELKPFMDSSNLRGGWQIANTVIPYAALWWLADWSLKHAPLLLIPTMVVMVLLLARIFSLMHDCGHDSLFRSRRANQVFGFLLGVLSAIPQYPWSRGHAYHHRHNGDWEKYQGPSALVTTSAFAALSPGQQRFYGVLRHPAMLFPGGFFYLVIKPRVALVLGLAGFFPT